MKKKKICLILIMVLLLTLFYLPFGLYFYFHYGIETTLFRDIAFVTSIFSLFVTIAFNTLMGIYDKEIENEK